MKVRCCIVGGGPAGMMLGYLLGRAGLDVAVLEKHADFFRDFRGDTVHPSTLQVMDELGLSDGFLKLPHQRLQKMDGMFGGASVRIADLGRLNVKFPFIAFMPQWDFLNFLRESGKKFASLKVMMNTEATDLIKDGARIAGVKGKDAGGQDRHRGRSHYRLRRPPFAGARTRRSCDRGDRRADGRAVVPRRQTRQRERERVRPRRSGRHDGDVRSR
jgi:2-polyprenyl-6-methoxyphenol hydroxylase-like FAD-dependent oxidoreductase